MADTVQRLSKLRKLVNKMQTLLNELEDENNERDECEHEWSDGYRVVSDIGCRGPDYIYLKLFQWCYKCRARTTEKEVYMGKDGDGWTALCEWKVKNPTIEER